MSPPGRADLPDRPLRVAYVVRSWPRLSQTFVVGEVLAVERLGARLTVFGLTRGDDPLVQPEAAEVRAPVTWLDELPAARRVADVALLARTAPGRLLATAAWALRRPWLTDGYATRSAGRSLLDAVTVGAWLLREGLAGRPVDHLHAHFAHDPALVALLASRLTGTPYTFTAHARDLYQLAPAALAERVAAAEVVVTCCRQNAAYLDRVVPPHRRRPVRVVHHGVRLSRFPVPPRSHPAGGSLALVSVGRLVEKKGFADLLAACAALRSTGRRCRLSVYGDGPLRADLEALRGRLGLDADVTFLGERTQADVIAALRDADAFVLTPYVAPDGDRDGIPNVLVEAMAAGLPVVSTRAGGVPELVTDGVSGLLAAPRDVPGIAAHLVRLHDDVPARRRLGAEARRVVERDFDVDVAARRLLEHFRAGVAPRERAEVGT